MTTLTKRMAEDLTNYFLELGVRVRYLHSDIETLERVQIVGDFRRGVFDVLVGVNLLREGLDLPEVSLVAVLDADKEGFLRSETSLIQTAGRAARNVNGIVVFYADRITDSMKRAIERDRAPAEDPGRLEHRARHRARVDREVPRLAAPPDGGPRLPRAERPRAPPEGEGRCPRSTARSRTSRRR